MTAPADLDAVRAALALVAKATPGPWSSEDGSTTWGDDTDLWSSVRDASGAVVSDMFEVTGRPHRQVSADAAAIVALRNAAPAIAAAVDELERLRADNKAFAREREIAMKLGGKINALRELADEAIGTASEAPDGGDQVADYRERLAVLNRQVCRLVSGQEIEGDLLCQHHGADVEALAQVARYQVAAVAVATEIGGSLGPVDDDPEERAAAFVRFAEGLAGRVRERVEALEADLVRALHRERRADDESGERLREMAELLIKDANNE